jgi:hypothetical protein
MRVCFSADATWIVFISKLFKDNASWPDCTACNSHISMNYKRRICQNDPGTEENLSHSSSYINRKSVGYVMGMPVEKCTVVPNRHSSLSVALSPRES